MSDNAILGRLVLHSTSWYSSPIDELFICIFVSRPIHTSKNAPMGTRLLDVEVRVYLKTSNNGKLTLTASVKLVPKLHSSLKKLTKYE